jgi:hypothetical protein
MGSYICERCGTKHESAGHHQDGRNVAPADQPELTRAILEVCAASTGHIPVTEALLTANPPPVGKDGRTREHKAWIERQIEGFGIILDLVDCGSLRAVEEPCGEDREHPWGVTVTDAGRASLATAS